MLTPTIRVKDNAKSQADFYCNVFTWASITSTNPVITSLQIFWQPLAILVGGDNPDAKPNPSISFSLWIKDKDLTQLLWDKLSEWWSVLMEYADYDWSKGYGWCNDRYGVSRQVMYDDRADTSLNQVVPSLMFIGDNNGKAHEAIKLYTDIFPNSSVWQLSPYGDNPMGEDPTHLNHAEFVLDGQQMITMDSGMDHQYQLNDGVSLMIICKDQDEVDHYRDLLTADEGTPWQCGWLKDKYGVSRQVVPTQQLDLIADRDSPQAKHAMSQMMQMKKIIIKDLYM